MKNMKRNQKIIISTLVLALLALPVVNAQIKTTSETMGTYLDGYVNVHGQSYVNPANGKLYIKDTNVVFEFEASTSVKKVRISDPGDFDYIVDVELDENGKGQISLKDLIATNPSRANYDDYHIVEYTGLDSKGLCVVPGRTQWIIKNSGSSASGTISCPLRVDTKSPTLKSWTVKQSLLGIKGTVLRVEASDDYSDRYSQPTVSGIQYVKLTVKDRNGSVVKSEKIDFNEQTKAIYYEFQLHDNILREILSSGFELELQDWAGHPPVGTVVSPDEIDVVQPKTHSLQNIILTLLQSLFYRFSNLRENP